MGEGGELSLFRTRRCKGGLLGAARSERGMCLGAAAGLNPPISSAGGRRARAWCVATHLPGRDVEISGQSLAHVQRREVLHLEDLLEEVERRRRNKPARLRVAIERLAGGHASCMGLLSVLHDDWLQVEPRRPRFTSDEASRLSTSGRHDALVTVVRVRRVTDLP